MACVLVSGSSGLVLCIGDDGHIAVKSEHHLNKGQTHDGAVEKHNEYALSDTSCVACGFGDCVDVPLGSSIVSYVAKPLTQDRRQRSNAGQFFLIACEPFAQTGVQGYQRPGYGATSILAQSLLEKRKIVLRI